HELTGWPRDRSEAQRPDALSTTPRVGSPRDPAAQAVPGGGVAGRFRMTRRVPAGDQSPRGHPRDLGRRHVPGATQPRVGHPAAGNRTPNDLLDTCLQWVTTSLKARTRQVYEDTLRRYVRPALGRQRLSAITPDKLQRLYAGLPRRGLRRTPAQVHATLHRAL